MSVDDEIPKFDEALKDDGSSELSSLKSVYKVCIETRNFEINQLIQRNNFFMLFQGVLLAAALQTEQSKPFVEFIVCMAGLFVSFYQLQMACGAKYWQEWWESRVEYFENELRKLQTAKIGHFYMLFASSPKDVRSTISNRLDDKGKYLITNFLVLRAFAVGRAPIKVSIVLIATWFVLILHSVDLSYLASVPNLIKGFSFVS